MMLRPDKNLKDIYEITPEMLKEMGIRAMLLDLDSTTMQSKTGEFTRETLEWFEQFKKDFYMAIVTNNHKQEYIERVTLGAPCKVYWGAHKPCPKTVKKIIKGLFMEPKHVVIIGDRPLTDILAGKLAGTKTILVGSINKKENLATKFVRFLERLTIFPF
ncbi:YqeG family HAD IIIA-type phosphatase [bacterium]|nr:YqeG family HAD IIIA-type phosphatase [bacterium]